MTHFGAEDLLEMRGSTPSTQNLVDIVNELHQEWAPEETPSPDQMPTWVCERFGTIIDVVTPENLNELIVERVMQLKTLDCFVKSNPDLKEDGDARDKIAHIGKIIRESRNALQTMAILFQRMDPMKRIAMPMDWNVESFFQFADVDEKTTTFQRLVQHVLQLCEVNELRKYEDSVYKQKKITVEVEGEEFCYDSHAWEPVCTIVEFIYKNVRKEVDYEQWKNMTNPRDNAEQVARHLEVSFQSELPRLDVNRYMWTYRNGIYNAEQDMFYPFSRRSEWESMAKEITDYRRRDPNGELWEGDFTAVAPKESDVCVKYMDTDFRFEITPAAESAFDAAKIYMPDFGKILDTQDFDDDSKKWFVAFLGRLFFEMGYDNWQRMLYIKGVAGSAKSTIAQFIRSFFPDHLLSTIANNVEPRFGLEPIYQSLICICTETREDFGLDQAAWQAAVSAESMSIPRKHKTAVTLDKWRTQLFFVGNMLPNYPTASGSVERRMMIFNFNKKAKAKDTQLDKKLLLNQDLFHRKAVSTYLAMKRKYGTQDLVEAEALGKQLMDFICEMRADVDIMYNFIKNACVPDVSADIPLRDFKKAFENYQTDMGHAAKKMKVSDMRVNLEGDGFLLVQDNKKHIIKGLRLKDEMDDEEGDGM